MKIALVNLSKIQDFSKTPYYQASLEFLEENNIDYVDYFSGRENFEDLLNGFHEALGDDSVDLVWFIQGGSELIQFLNKIDWDLVRHSHKSFLGQSDFTHFAFRAIPLGVTCYYGPGLKQIKDYFPTAEQRQFVLDFLQNRKLQNYNGQILRGTTSLTLEDERIIGGHSFISAIMLAGAKIDMSNRVLFFEHHYIPGEEPKDVGYFLEAIKLNLASRPKAIILGHSVLFDKDKNMIDVAVINKYLLEQHIDLDIPVFYVDHFQKILKLS